MVVLVEVVSGSESRATAKLERGITCRLTWSPDTCETADIAIRQDGGEEVLREKATPSSNGTRALTVLLPPGSYVASLLGDGETLEVPFLVGRESADAGLGVVLAR